MTRISNAERIRQYGDPADGRPPSVVLGTPWGMRVRCQPDVVPWFVEACERAAVESDWAPRRIDHQVVRQIRGRGSWSLHSWALAWDFFATPPGVPPPGGVWTPYNGVPEDFARPFEELGFTWGGRWTGRPDTPHIEWAGPKPTGIPPTEDDDDMTPEQDRRLEELHRAVVGMVGAEFPLPAGQVHNIGRSVQQTNGIVTQLDPVALAERISLAVSVDLDDADVDVIADAVRAELAEALTRP